MSDFSDEFTSLNTDDWVIYDGAGHDGAGIRLPLNAYSAASLLTLVGTTSGRASAVRLANKSQQYGQWEFRVRVKAGQSYYRPRIRLWGVGGGEAEPNPNGSITVLEAVRSADRSVNTFSIGETSFEVTVDLTQWHVFIVVWTAELISFYIDGELAWSSDDTDIQPTGEVDLQILLDYFEAEVAANSKPVASNYLAASMEVDYARQLVTPTLS